MKNIVKSFLGILNTIFINYSFRDIKSKGTKFYWSRINQTVNNNINIINSIVKNTLISIEGSGNQIFIDSSEVFNSRIEVCGLNNTIFVDKKVKLHKAIISLRGTNCSVSIGSGTTFHEIRIVNVGKNNPVSIGENCLFADRIEVWASDTHSIYDDQGNFINPEKPVIIGNNTWIGSHVKILKGVTIGEGAIVGMNTLVTKSVKSKSLNVGNPMQCIKENVTWSEKYENE